MKLRTIVLVSTLALGLLAGPFPTKAQQANKIPRIGLLISGGRTATAPLADAFREGLRELGYV